MVSEEQYDRLVRLIYDASLDPPQWREFLRAYSAATRSPSVALVVQNFRDHRANVDETANVDPRAKSAYEEYYASVNVWIVGRERLYVPGGITNSADMLTDAELRRTEYYADYLRPNDWMYSHGCVIERNTDMASFMTGLRGPQAGPFGDAEKKLIGRLLPHLQCAMRVHHRLAGSEANLQAASEALDRLSVAIIVADAARRVSFVNQAAQQIVAARDGLFLHARRLHASGAGDDRKLGERIARAVLATLAAAPARGSAFSIERPSGRLPLEALVLPLPSGSALARGKPAALLLLADPDTPVGPDPLLLTELYGLTPAEAKLTAALVRGATVERYAAEACLSANTVRTHLKSAFSKIGVKRQSELVQRVLNGSARFHR